MLPTATAWRADLERERGAREQAEAGDGALLFSGRELFEHGSDTTAIEHRRFGHGFRAVRRQSEFNASAVAARGAAREVAELFEAGQRGGERRGCNAEMACEVARGGRARFVEMREHRGVVRGEVVAIGFRAHVVDVAREVDLRIGALHGADEGRVHRGGE